MFIPFFQLSNNFSFILTWKKIVYLVNGGEPSSSTTSNPMFQLSRNPDKSHREIFYSLTFFVLSTCFQHAPNRNAHASCLLLTVSWEQGRWVSSTMQYTVDLPWIQCNILRVTKFKAQTKRLIIIRLDEYQKIKLN